MYNVLQIRSNYGGSHLRDIAEQSPRSLNNGFFDIWATFFV